MDETRHGDETNKEDETVMDADQGNSASTRHARMHLDELTWTLQCSCISYHNCDRAPT
jgi:hypothetical protein